MHVIPNICYILPMSKYTSK